MNTFLGKIYRLIGRCYNPGMFSLEKRQLLQQNSWSVSYFIHFHWFYLLVINFIIVFIVEFDLLHYMKISRIFSFMDHSEVLSFLLLKTFQED